MKYTFSQFIPIILLFLIVSNPDVIIQFSNMSIGRFIAVAIILFYSSINKYLGLLSCMLIVLYYQLYAFDDQKEFFENLSFSHFDENKVQPQKVLETSPVRYADYSSLYKTECATPTPKNHANSVLKKHFTDRFCDRDVLKYKDVAVRSEMVQHVFPEIQFTAGKCNPCSATCDFSIIANKLHIEEKMKPISTVP
uniref:Uncharacterized protein n=1 Tax=viral metagenome TaxID=1070528 RepID=A0A6C0HAJ8_9ZZZZ